MKKRSTAKVVMDQQLMLPPEFQAAERDVADLCPAIKADHERFVDSARSAIQAGISCGRRLWCAKELAGHGRWEQLFEDELQPVLGFDIRTAQRYMAVYAEFMRFLRRDPTIAAQTLNLSDELVQSFKMHWARGKTAKPSPNDWVSPPELLAIAERLLKSIECDPAATVEQAANCPAGQTRYSVEDDGLNAECRWMGRAFIAPGHTGPLTAWVQKALGEFRSGSMSEGVLLLPAAIASDWPAEIVRFQTAISREPPYVLVSKDKQLVSRRLPSRLLLIHMTTQPNLAEFQAAINEMFVVFGPTPANSKTDITVAR